MMCFAEKALSVKPADGIIYWEQTYLGWGFETLEAPAVCPAVLTHLTKEIRVGENLNLACEQLQLRPSWWPS